MTERRTKPARKPPDIIGWRERVALPDFGISEMAAKIDTGARTSALHAIDQTVVEKDGRRYVDFTIPAAQGRRSTRVSAEILDARAIKNTSGVPETRLVVRTALVLGRHHWHIELSLADREKMEFDLILGRTAIRGRRILVNPGRSYITGPPDGRPREKGSSGVAPVPATDSKGART